MKEYDFLVIGSGIGGLSFALQVADSGSVAVVTKSGLDECNTRYAQGGMACVTYAPDTFEKHVRDTLVCGAGICNEKAVRHVVTKAPENIAKLIDWGTRFDTTPEGLYDLYREGGHSENRILHHHDLTGAEVERALVERARRHPNITVHENCFAVDLLTQHHLGRLVRKSTPDITCFGAYVLDLTTGMVHTFLARATLLATGGVGNIYHTTTNPRVATGDGIAMVHRAKGVVENMEFIQFHPTALFNPGERPSFLISEAMRGFGGILRLQNGEEFMHKYHTLGSLAPRDVVARSIDHELKMRGEEFVYLDITHRDRESILAHFPNIYEKCLTIGIDITRQMIPVCPAAHYCCGGVRVDLDGRTSIRNLYAVGEISSTGLHGANRLASNSLIEAIVYASQAAAHAIALLPSTEFCRAIPEWDCEGTSHPEEMVLITHNYRDLQQIMSNYVGIVRSNLRLDRARTRLGIIFKETEELYLRSTLNQPLCELRNMIAVAYLIIKQARELRQSVGAHYSIDYPIPNISEY
ncbi:MAG: L-aspartate oxidase [Rikenellaceae bacterium]|jgi:L-aspartate oxidase|nr:L-aspartate oxidase [Rikenellaceae bacterium]